MIRITIASLFFFSAVCGAYVVRGFILDCINTWHRGTPWAARVDDIASAGLMGSLSVLVPLCLGLVVMGVFS